MAALEEQVRLSFLFLFEEPLLGLPINWFGGADVGPGEKIERGQGGRQLYGWSQIFFFSLRKNVKMRSINGIVCK